PTLPPVPLPAPRASTSPRSVISSQLAHEEFLGCPTPVCEGERPLAPREPTSSLVQLGPSFQIRCEPIQERLVPKLGVLRFQHPMAFVGKDHQFRWNALPLQRAEEFH